MRKTEGMLLSLSCLYTSRRRYHNDITRWTRFWPFICCTSPEYTDGHH